MLVEHLTLLGTVSISPSKKRLSGYGLQLIPREAYAVLKHLVLLRRLLGSFGVFRPPSRRVSHSSRYFCEQFLRFVSLTFNTSIKFE